MTFASLFIIIGSLEKMCTFVEKRESKMRTPNTLMRFAALLITATGVLFSAIIYDGKEYTETMMPYSYKGQEETYIVVSGTVTSYSGDRLSIFEINGVNMNSASELPDPLDGKKYFIHFKGQNKNATINISGSNDWTVPEDPEDPGDPEDPEPDPEPEPEPEIPDHISYGGNDYSVEMMPYSYKGNTEYFIVVSGTIASYSSNALNIFEINGVNMNNASELPEPVDGKKYFIHFKGARGNSTININGTNDWSQPEMTVSPATLTGFTTDPETPSSEQSFTVSGQNLTSNISLSAAAAYEISLTSGSGFVSSLTLSPSGCTVGSTTIYVRLKSGLSAGSYDQDITISNTDAGDQIVTCSGIVEDPNPSITVSPTTLTGFVTEPDAPSLELSFTLSGQYLTADISLTAPSSYEISLTSGTGFTSGLTLTPSGGTVNSTTIYVRLKSGLSAGSYDGESITISTAGASDQTVTCSGEVIENPSPSLTVGPASLSGFNYKTGNGPSPEQTFTVGGQYLASDISLSAPAAYEISATSGSGFASSLTLTPSEGTVSSTTIYIRLKSGLSAGSYNENITISTADADDQTVTISGFVEDPNPDITVSPTTLTGFTADPVTPSAEQSFTVSGQDLASNISLSAPAGYEISTTSGSGFGPNLTLSPSGGTVSSTTIYVRLRSGLSAGSYNENITISTADADDQTVTCSGIVEIPTVINWNGNDYTFVEMPFVYEGGSVTRIYTYGKITSFGTNNFVTSLEINGQSFAVNQTNTEPPASIDQKYFITITPKNHKGSFEIDGETKNIVYKLNIKVLLEGAL